MNRSFAKMMFAMVTGMLFTVAAPGCKKSEADSAKAETSADAKKPLSAAEKSAAENDAKADLRAIAKGAIAYFEAEHPSSDGMSVTTKVYPNCDGKGCQAGQHTLGKPASADTVGIQFNPADYASATGASPWKELFFVLKSPFRYSYDYVSEGGQGASTFTAWATASLDAECDSIFYVTGDADGRVSEVLDHATVLNLIANGAKAYFENEHFSSDGMNSWSKVYPNCGGNGCKAGDNPWADLHITPPTLPIYRYEYISEGGSGNSTFTARAVPLPTSKCTSVFEIKGNPDGTVSEITITKQ